MPTISVEIGAMPSRDESVRDLVRRHAGQWKWEVDGRTVDPS